METKKIWLDVVQARQPAKWQVVLQLIVGVIFMSSGLFSIMLGRRDALYFVYFAVGLITVPIYLVSFWRPQLFFFNQPSFVEFYPDQLAVKQGLMARTRFISWSRITGVDFKPGQAVIHIQEEKSPICLRPSTYAKHMEIRGLFVQYAKEKGIELSDWQNKSEKLA